MDERKPLPSAPSAAAAVALLVSIASSPPPIRGLHSFTSQLNVSRA